MTVDLTTGAAGPAAAARDADVPPTPEALDSTGAWRTPGRIRALLVVDAVAAVAYAAWWVVPGHVGNVWLFAVLLLAEAFTFSHVVGLWWAIGATRVVPPPAPTRTWTVDVLIPTYGEPLAVLEATLAAAVGLRGTHTVHTTYLLDDARRPEVARLAKAYGAQYRIRPDNAGAKAGNLNRALAQSKADLVAVFDADHVPHPDFLDRLVGYFEDDGIAFVQTPQYYANAAHSRVARGAYDQQALFYGPICRGKSGLGAAFCCGTNVVFRRTALASVGGFDTDSVVEDFVTSIHLHRKGWRSVYYPYVLAAGIGPTTLATFFSQQYRWARGSVGALVTGEPFKPGLTRAQRFQYLLATTFYLSGLATLVYVLLPILYMLFGLSAFSASAGSFVFVYAPFLVLGLLTVRWGLGRQLSLDHLRYTFGTFPVYALASLSAITGRTARFNVTSKDEAAAPPPPLALVPVALQVLTVVACVYGFTARPIDARTWTNASWATINVLLLAGVGGAALAELRAAVLPPRRHRTRHRAQAPEPGL